MDFKKALFILSALLLIFIISSEVECRGRGAPRAPNEHCDCHYQPDRKGCTISRGPELQGYKCRCRISRFFLVTHCLGTRVQCSSGENCPAGCASKECCMMAGGDCAGY